MIGKGRGLGSMLTREVEGCWVMVAIEKDKLEVKLLHLGETKNTSISILFIV